MALQVQTDFFLFFSPSTWLLSNLNREKESKICAFVINFQAKKIFYLQNKLSKH